MYFQREIYDRVQALSQQFPALVLTGARQTGKTTLLRSLFPGHHYVSLDLPSAADLAERDPESFLAQHPAPLLVDEVQYAPGLFRHLKIAIDGDRHSTGRFILTGSQKFNLMKAVSDSLAGRCAIVELETLSFEEISQHLPYPKNVGDLVGAIVRGGFPDLWRDPGIDANAYYRAYLSTYLERDVRQILNVASLRDFERFLRACAARSAQLLDKAALARDVGVSSKAANDWLSVLEASNQVQLLEPYFENLGKRLIKSPKLYLSDTGLLCFLLGLDERSLPQSPYLGTVWESAVYAQLRKQRDRAGDRSTLWFYRDAQQREVDFVMALGTERHLIEAKWTENPSTRDSENLQSVGQILIARGKAPQVHASIVCRTPHSSVLSDGTRVVDLAQLSR
jgi:predicted AAA+ superfamily ATPase